MVFVHVRPNIFLINANSGLDNEQQHVYLHTASCRECRVPLFKKVNCHELSGSVFQVQAHMVHPSFILACCVCVPSSGCVFEQLAGLMVLLQAFSLQSLQLLLQWLGSLAARQSNAPMFHFKGMAVLVVNLPTYCLPCGSVGCPGTLVSSEPWLPPAMSPTSTMGPFLRQGGGILSRGWLPTVEAPGYPRYPPSI